MKERILRLCKRLNKFSLDEIETISELEQSDLQIILNELVVENKIKIINGEYLYQGCGSQKYRFPILQYYNCKLEVIDLLIKCFCCNIPACQTKLLLNLCEETTIKYYNIFRNSIYNKQLNDLKILYHNNPQKSHYRLFFDKIAYFYIYNNKVYVIDVPFNTNNEKLLSKNEKAEFKKINSYLQRVESHNKNSINLKYKLAEALWRRNKNFDELYAELKNMFH